MITVQLVLRVGNLVRGAFREHDSFDMGIMEFHSDVACENINELLNVAADPIGDYAELRLQVSGGPRDGFLIGSFRRVKLKTKGSNNQYRWIVVD